MKNICCTGCNSEKIHKISSILHVIFEQKKYNENRNYYTELWKKRIRLNSKYNILLIQNKKLTRKKFVNIRYVSYRAREEMNKLGMK